MDDLMQTDGCGGGPYYKLRLSTYYYYTVIDVLIRTGGCGGGPYYKLRFSTSTSLVPHSAEHHVSRAQQEKDCCLAHQSLPKRDIVMAACVTSSGEHATALECKQQRLNQSSRACLCK